MADDDNTRPVDPDASTKDLGKPSAVLPKKIGHYSIRSIIASGGMGTVYLAQQEQPRRVVALKVMKKGIASKSALRRFEYESQILARLKHPNVAQVYEAGTHDDGEGGVPFFAMEYIANAKTIIEYAKSKKLSTRERLAMFAKVCDAVHHGHQKGIIHRDLKPGNILVDSGGEPKIIDFGVARATDSDMAITTLQTDIGQLIGTLQYMSPEQCEGDPHDLDTRSDVYALGVVLYELLTDQLPYDLSKVAMYEAARVIREETPAKPSTINKTLRGDVETIVLKALEKERNRRYTTSAELSRDIQRYLIDEPIEARSPSMSYQIRMFAKRNKAVFAVFMTFAAALPILGVATVVAVLSAAEAVRARNAELMLRRPLEMALEESNLQQLEIEKHLMEIDKLLMRSIDSPLVQKSLTETLTARIRQFVQQRDAGIASAQLAREESARHQTELNQVIRLLVDASEELGEHEQASYWRSRLPLDFNDEEVQLIITAHNRQVLALRRIHSYGLLSVEWIDSSGRAREETSTDVEIWIDRPYRTALTFRKIGEYLAWFGSDAERNWVFDLTKPDDTRLFIEEHNDARLPFQGKTVPISCWVLTDFLGLIEITDDTLTRHIVQIDVDNDALAFDVKGTAGPLRILFDRTTRLPRAVSVLTIEGETVLQSELGAYKEVVDYGNAPETSLLMPTSIVVVNFASNMTMTLELDESAINDDQQPWGRVFDLSLLREKLPTQHVEDTTEQ